MKTSGRGGGAAHGEGEGRIRSHLKQPDTRNHPRCQSVGSQLRPGGMKKVQLCERGAGLSTFSFNTLLSVFFPVNGINQFFISWTGDLLFCASGGVIRLIKDPGALCLVHFNLLALHM